MNRQYGWAEVNNAIARRLISLHENEEVLGYLAWALETSCIQLPVFEEGDKPDDIDPFTFMAAWSRPMPDHRRARLLALVCEALEVDAPVPGCFEGYPLVQDWQARMFSRNVRNAPREISALWNLLVCALAYADAVHAAGRTDVNERAADLVGAYNQLSKVRCPAKKLAPIILAWIAPDTFDYLGEAPGTGEEYLALLGTPGSPSVLVNETPSLGQEETSTLLDAFAYACKSAPRDTPPTTARAASTFLAHWDADATDFSDMLNRAFADAKELLFGGYLFNPLREITVLAEKEPEMLRAAFKLLFDESRQLEERVVPFMRSACALFESHRGDIVRATARGSAHGSFKTAAAYLYLRFPETHFPFSPDKLRALDARCAYHSHYRLSQPECLSYYDAMCRDVHERLVKRTDFEELMACRGLAVEAGLSRRARANILVDELATFACAREC